MIRYVCLILALATGSVYADNSCVEAYKKGHDEYFDLVGHHEEMRNSGYAGGVFSAGAGFLCVRKAPGIQAKIGCAVVATLGGIFSYGLSQNQQAEIDRLASPMFLYKLKLKDSETIEDFKFDTGLSSVNEEVEEISAEMESGELCGKEGQLATYEDFVERFKSPTLKN